LAKEGKGKEAMEMQRHQPDAIQRVKSVGKGGEADLIESVTHHIRGMDKQSGFPSIFRKPIRVTITLPHNIYNHLKVRSDEEGRSLSNLAAFLLEKSLN
jgi:hypothetical protein